MLQSVAAVHPPLQDVPSRMTKESRMLDKTQSPLQVGAKVFRWDSRQCSVHHPSEEKTIQLFGHPHHSHSRPRCSPHHPAGLDRVGKSEILESKTVGILEGESWAIARV